MPSTSKSQPEPRKKEAYLLRLLVAAIRRAFLGFRDVELPMEQAERGTSFRLFGLADPVPNPMGSLRA